MLLYAGGRVPRVLHGWKTIQEPTKNFEWGPLRVQTARGHLLCGAMSEGVVSEVHDGGQQELDACLLRIDWRRAAVPWLPIPGAVCPAQTEADSCESSWDSVLPCVCAC